MYYYPAKLIQTTHEYIVDFIPFQCKVTGKSLDEVFEKAQNALGKHLNSLNPKDIPTSSTMHCCKLKDNESILTVCCDLNEYRRKYENTYVRKNLTIPSWLNKLAEENNINFSQTLQKALKKELNIE